MEAWRRGGVGRYMSANLQHTKSKLHVNSGSCTLENTKGAHNLRWHAIIRLVDLEVLQRSLSLSTPVPVRLDLDLAKGIAFCSGGRRHCV